MNEEQYVQIREDLARNNQEHESYNRRLREHDEALKRQGDILLALQRQGDAIERLTGSMTRVEQTISGMSERLESIEREPGEKWKKIGFEILKWAVLGILAFAAGALLTK